MSQEQHQDQHLEEHSLHYLEMAFRTDKHGIIKHPDGYGKKTGQCGDTIEMFLSIKDDKIEAIYFQIIGCMNTNACSNTIAFMVEGKTVEQAWEIISPEVIAAYLETLPPDHIHCAELAAGTFYMALTDYQKFKKTPWKKFYR